MLFKFDLLNKQLVYMSVECFDQLRRQLVCLGIGINMSVERSVHSAWPPYHYLKDFYTLFYVQHS